MKYSDYIEKKRHGFPDFPIQYYYVDKTNPRYFMNAHWHKEFEIIRVLSGTFTAYLNNVSYVLKDGDVLFAESCMLIRGEPTDAVYECIVFDLNMLSSGVASKYILPLINSSVKISRIFYPKENEINKIATAIFSAMRDEKSGYELLVYSELFSLMHKFYTQVGVSEYNTEKINHQAQAISLLLDWIEKNYAEPISLEVLSEISGLSKKYLCKVFKEYTLKTPIEYVNELKIEHACHEILQSNKSITFIAFDCGFNDLSYFCKTFKKYKGLTPNEYKKLIQKSKKRTV